MRIRWSARKKSYIFKVRGYFLVVLCVPIVTLIILNIWAQSTIKEQIILSNQTALEQASQMIDTVSKEMKESCLKVANIRNVKDYGKVFNSSQESIEYKRYNLVIKLGEHVKEKYRDVFVYYPQDNYVVSGVNGALNLKNYHASYYGESAKLEEFYNMINRSLEYPYLYVMNSQGTEAYLCVMMRQEVTNSQGYYVIGIVLNSSYLKNLLNFHYNGRIGNMLLFDRNGELLLANNKDVVQYNLKGYSGETIPYEAVFDGENYIMQIQESVELKGYCGFATPTRYFWEKLIYVRRISVVLIGICVVVCVVLVLRSSKKAYAPLGKLLGDLQREGLEMVYNKDVSEFEYLTEIFKMELKEKQTLYTEIREAKNEKRDGFLFRLLEGWEMEETFDDVFEQNGITCCSDRFATGIIMFENGYSPGNGIISFIIGNVFEEIFNRLGNAYVLTIKEGKYILFLNLAIDVGVDKLFEGMTEGKNFFERSCGLHLTISFSDIHEGVHEIQKAFAEAEKALKYRYILGKELIIPYQDISNRTFSYLDSGKAVLSLMFEDYLEKEAYVESVDEFVSDIFKMYGIDESVSLETMECFKFDVINSVNRISFKFNHLTEKRHDIIQSLLMKETIQEFKEYLSYLLVLIQKGRMEKQNNGGVSQRARKYIEEHYMDTQLCLSIVGEAVGMSISHLSKLYKESYGVSVSHDITCVRLKNAKNFLQYTDLTINEIADRTGFTNSNVFIKVFKKWEGVTPGRYRDLFSDN